jgi:hypothetical protein
VPAGGLTGRRYLSTEGVTQMKTLSQREQEIQHSQERPFFLAEKLASNIRDYCQNKRLHTVAVDCKGNHVMLTREPDGQLIIEALGKKSVGSADADTWQVGHKVMNEDDMLDVVLEFLNVRWA